MEAADGSKLLVMSVPSEMQGADRWVVESLNFTFEFFRHLTTLTLAMFPPAPSATVTPAAVSGQVAKVVRAPYFR
jgi:hypothetical protein